MSSANDCAASEKKESVKTEISTEDRIKRLENAAEILNTRLFRMEKMIDNGMTDVMRELCKQFTEEFMKYLDMIGSSDVNSDLKKKDCNESSKE